MSGGALSRLSLEALPTPTAGTLYAASVSGSYYACLLRIAVQDTGAEISVRLDAPDLSELDGPSSLELDTIRALARAPAWEEEGALDEARGILLRQTLARLRPSAIDDAQVAERLDGWHLGGLVASPGARHAFSASSPHETPAGQFWRSLFDAALQGLHHWKSLAALDQFSFYDRTCGQLLRDCGGRPRHLRVLAWDAADCARALEQLARLPGGEPVVIDVTPGNFGYAALVTWALRRPGTALVASSGVALADTPPAALCRVFPSVAEARAALVAGRLDDRGPEHLG